MMDESKPIFIQLAERIEGGIIDGTYPEESQVPSTNEFAAFLRINPATAGKGLNRLVEKDILYKRRGIGMFVRSGAREKLVRQRRQAFSDQYIEPLLDEAARLGIAPTQLADMITSAAARQPQEATP
ncbi:GntR family transcriptional regulator [Zafaria sp. Z1313]|uniref:GntR family transcriptional regulator n=1 Tax=unclassified Zafaria TaxID=2828765 RepID=UPI002E77FA92|nr:GntR family transcriptional regulator [Zafaria sp. J156]MEE1621826.1 GntR family transcriptional regulator [Zafaria sp. J156]